jgi:tetratricopeptide (TPR) repeat protein
MALGELLPLPAAPGAAPIDADPDCLERLRWDFQQTRIAPIASDLMGAAFVLGQQATVRDVAIEVLDGTLASTAATRRLAERLIEAPAGRAGELASVEILEPNSDARRGELRRLLAASPRNALRWSDLGRLQTAIGKDREATRAMQVARALAPDDRHVLRSSARLAIHRHRPDEARALLLASPRTRQDPWLLACEISAADIMQQRSPLLRVARQLLADERFSDHELSELASVVATIELGAGDLRASRQLFRRALRAPSDNSIAQVTWAAPQLGLDYDAEALAIPASWEARAIAAHRGGDWKLASDEASQWLEDQPFASRPGELGSYEAAKGGDFKRGLEFAERALHANPTEFLLRNNAAFCLLSMDDSRRAKPHLDAIERRKDSLSADEIVTFTATLGLYHYRARDPERGRQLYLQAIRSSHDRTSRALATIMLAREETLAGLDTAVEARERAVEIAENDEAGLGAWVKQLETLNPRAPSVTIWAGTPQVAPAPMPRSLPDAPAAAPTLGLPRVRRRTPS